MAVLVGDLLVVRLGQVGGRRLQLQDPEPRVGFITGHVKHGLVATGEVRRLVSVVRSITAPVIPCA